MKKKVQFFLPIILVMLMQFPYAAVYAQPSLTLNTAGNPPLHYPNQTGIIDLLAHEVFGRIGIKVHVQHLPPERALINANNGIDDGDVARIGGLTAKYPNLIQVPAKIFETDFVAFTNNKNIHITNWEELKPYDVAIVKGHQISEQNVVGTQSLVKAENIELLFKLLKNKRTDLIICERIFGFEMKEKLQMADVRILEPPLASLDFFIYLHNKHHQIVKDLVKSIGDIHEDGTYVRLYPRDKYTNNDSKP